MSGRIDFTSQDYLRNPAPAIERLRAAGPVVEVHFPIVGKTWITTAEHAASCVLKDGHTFTLRKDDGTTVGMRWWMPGVFRTLANNMLTTDEPDHTRLRSIVDEAFRRRAILEMAPRILAIAEALAAELFADGSPADLVGRYARKLPLSVICELLGLPAADRPKFMGWAANLTGVRSTLGFVWRMMWGVAAIKRYLEAHIESARASGRGADWRARSGREGGHEDQPRRDGSNDLPALIRRLRDHHPPHQRRRLRARENPCTAGLAQGGLETRRSRGRGILAFHLAGKLLEAALRAQGYGALWCTAHRRETLSNSKRSSGKEEAKQLIVSAWPVKRTSPWEDADFNRNNHPIGKLGMLRCCGSSPSWRLGRVRSFGVERTARLRCGNACC